MLSKNIFGGRYDDYLYKTAQTHKGGTEENLPQMIYIDLHCDTVTQCFDKGYALVNCDLQTNFEKLKENGCAAQCFAIFTQGDGAALCFEKYLGFYLDSIEKYGIIPVKNKKDLDICINENKTGGILTVENLGFTGGDLTKLNTLAEAGVRMASFVWNFENEFAYPNLIFRNGLPEFGEREKRGLKPLGRQAVEILDSLKIIVDVSHLSDGGTDEILEGRKIPIVASHSNSASVLNVSRNLTDSQIKKIADCGGVIGVNFCKDFLGVGETYGCVLNHIKHIVRVGGEDVIAIGSDFDGIPAPPDLEDCSKMPKLTEYLGANGISDNLIEKLCYKNFARVFKEVCG